ncbi:MAG: phosphotransferase family protein [Leptolyngbyaceae cyanobacterium]
MSSSTVLNLGQLCEALRSHLYGRHLLESDDTVELLAHGEANVIFRLNSDRLVRVAVNTPNQRFGGDFSRVTAFEASILGYLQGTGLGHQLLDAQLQPGVDFPYTYLITNYLPGEPLDYSHLQLQQCATTLARLHRLPLQTEGDRLYQLMPLVQRVSQPLSLFFQEAWDYAQPYITSSDADSDIVDMLETLLTKAQTRLAAETLLTDYPHECLVHSDHTYENWVINPQQAYLIDWEWAEIGSPAGDLGHFLSPVTVRRYRHYQLPADDKQFFLNAYYNALGDVGLAQTMRVHFAVFGAFPALRSLCWTAGYWVTARRWYAGADNSSAVARMERLRESQRQFSTMWAEVMALLEEPLP